MMKGTMIFVDATLYFLAATCDVKNRRQSAKPALYRLTRVEYETIMNQNLALAA